MQEIPDTIEPGDAPGHFWLNVARWFIEQPLDQAINRLLATLGRHHDSDRAWVMRYSEDLSCLSNSHEWARDGVEAFVSDLQNVPATMIGTLHEGMLRNQVVYFDVAKMRGPSLRLLRSEFLRQNNQAVLCLPLWHERRLVGMFGYDAVRERTVWPDEAVGLLRQAGGLIAPALSRSVSHRPDRDELAETPDIVFINQADGRFALPTEDILLIESQGDYTRIEVEGSAPLLQLRTLTDWAQFLPRGKFIRVHRRFIVNRMRIQSVSSLKHGRWVLMLSGRMNPVAVGRQYRAAVRSGLNI